MPKSPKKETTDKKKMGPIDTFFKNQGAMVDRHAAPKKGPIDAWLANQGAYVLQPAPGADPTSPLRNIQYVGGRKNPAGSSKEQAIEVPDDDDDDKDQHTTSTADNNKGKGKADADEEDGGGDVEGTGKGKDNGEDGEQEEV
ncbi:hypothetical protein CALVIDRAFT_567034 [Calocera viscosa TUFC12733]|uniref:Uncharacterized protein n=1 Tax=Calocera viscosa (strain TUFC12733) TaxID=1330018 RepID=A0A167IK58_CALVF|nr:hypothetical protein CALVIDRAFT_567034 [Calocera viscosa TUFC12733]